MVYQVKIRGALGEDWSEWLGAVRVRHEPASDGSPLTILVIDVKDSAALFGVLERIRDLHLSLVSLAELPVRNRRRKTCRFFHRES